MQLLQVSFLYLFVGTQKNCLSETVPLCTQMTKFNRIWALYLCRFNVHLLFVFTFTYIIFTYLFIH